MSGPGPTAVQQLSRDQPHASPRKAYEDLGQGGRRGDSARWESDVVDAEADVVDTLLTMRELASNTTGSDRLVQFAGGYQNGIRRESAEDDQGTHRSDSVPTGTAAGPTAAALRDGFGSQRQIHVGPQSVGPGSRPSSGATSHALASRPNSFSGKKRKPVVNEDDAVNGSCMSAHYRTGDAREAATGMPGSETAALQLQQQLTAAAAAAEALAWQQGAMSASGGQTGAPPVAVGRVASEPLINGGQRLSEAVLARLGLGSLGAAAAGDAAAVERLRALVLGSVAGPGSTNGGAAADQLPSAKRPHVLSRQASAAATAMAAAAAAAASAAGGLSLSADDLRQLAQHQQQPGPGAAVAATDWVGSGRQDWPHGSAAAPAPGPTGISIKVEHGAELEAPDAAAARVTPTESPAADQPTQRSGPAGAPAAVAPGAMSRGPGARAARRCTPPSPLGHHSDTGSDSGSPSARAPYSPARTGGAGAGAAGGGGGGGGAAAAVDAAAAVVAPPPGAGNPEGDEPTAPAGPARTSSVISLLHMLAIRQQQQQQQQQQQRPAVQGRAGAAPPPRVGEAPDMTSGGDAMTAGEPPGRGLREWDRDRDMADPRVVGVSREQQLAAAAGPGVHIDGGAVGAPPYGSVRPGHHVRGGGGVGGGAAVALQREMPYNSREHPYIGGGVAADMMQVDETSSMPQPPHRTVSETAEVLQAAAAGVHPAASARNAAAAAAASERTCADFDMAAAGANGGVPYSGNGMTSAAAAAATAAAAGANDERIHASLAAIERKLLLQEERLVYELKQVRLMQKLLHVQQMKQMVREAMRGKERDGTGAAAAAAAAAVLGAEGLLGSGSPFRTPETPAATNGPAGEGADPGLARLASLPAQLLAAVAARAAAVGGGAGGGDGGVAREMSGVEILRTSSDASAAVAAAVHHGGGGVEQPLAPHGYQQVYGKAPYQQRRVRSEVLGDADAAAGAPREEAWSALGADGGGRLLSYIAALSSGKGAAEPRQGPASGPQAQAAAAAALLAAVRRDGGPPSGGSAFVGGEAGSPIGQHRDGGGAAAALHKGAFPATGRGVAVYEVGDMNGAEAATGVALGVGGGGGGVPSEEEAALLQARLLQALLKHGRHQALHDAQMMTTTVALNGAGPEGADGA